MKIFLDPKDNEEYGALIEGYNSITDEWNKINDALHRRRIPAVFWSKSMRNLKAIGKRLATLQKRWLEHHAKAVRFHANPHYVIPEGPASTVTFQHYQDVLIYRINHYEATMTLLVSNYNLAESELRHRRDFNIAITSFILGLIALFIALAR